MVIWTTLTCVKYWYYRYSGDVERPVQSTLPCHDPLDHSENRHAGIGNLGTRISRLESGNKLVPRPPDDPGDTCMLHWSAWTVPYWTILLASRLHQGRCKGERRQRPLLVSDCRPPHDRNPLPIAAVYKLHREPARGPDWRPNDHTLIVYSLISRLSGGSRRLTPRPDRVRTPSKYHTGTPMQRTVSTPGSSAPRN